MSLMMVESISEVCHIGTLGQNFSWINFYIIIFIQRWGFDDFGDFEEFIGFYDRDHFKTLVDAALKLGL